jgi:thioredoxin 1
MKKFIFCALAMAACFYILPAAFADENEVVISPEQWKTATDQAPPGHNWQHSGSQGAIAAPEGREAKAQPQQQQQNSAFRPGGGSLVNANDSNFYSQAMRSSEPVVVEFWRPGCGHCVKMEGAVNDLAGGIKVVRVNTDENEKAPARFGVNGVPAFFLVKDGNIVGSAVGSMPEDRLKKKLGLE